VIPPDRLRAFSIIAHIDHGKTTLTDRVLELTRAVDPRQMREQYMDSMDLERERGITIKAQNVRLTWKDYTLQLIDTPGHVDFGYEVSRSLAACEGAVLLVDASQGIQAQTLANAYQAIDHDLEIVPVLNKIDLPSADPERFSAEIENVLGIPADSILHVSAKTGEGVAELLDAIVDRVPPPKGDPSTPLRGLIFDSYYDQYRGVVSAVRVMEGTLPSGSRLWFMQARAVHDIEEIGVRTPDNVPVAELGPGEVGYLIAGIKDVAEARSGETVTEAARRADEPLTGYRDPKPMVFCGLYPVEGDDYAELRDALEKLRLNDASFNYEPETSGALGFGFRCGFLGLLHMEIVRERLEREFDLSLIATAPSVEYLAHLTNGQILEVDNPSDMPPPNELESIEEPFFTVTILLPAEYTGTVMDLCQTRRGEMVKMEYLSEDRLELVYRIPLAEVVVDFFDQLKGRTKGYASLDYEPAGYVAANLVKVDVLLNSVPVDAFSAIVHRDEAANYGRKMTARLRELIPRQMFDVPIQAAVGGRIIARETV
jgi:GTP-binding protein LepA